jgi:hypothetical protein
VLAAWLRHLVVSVARASACCRCGVAVPHVTIYRWVQRFTPLLMEATRSCRHTPGDRWFVDEASWESQGVAAGILRVEPAGCGLSRWRGDR